MKIASYAVEASASSSYTRVESHTTLITRGNNQADKANEGKEAKEANAGTGAQQAAADEEGAALELSDQVEQMLKEQAQKREEALQGLKQGGHAGKIKGANKDAVVINAAGALVVGGKATDFSEGVTLAQSLIESGAALKKLNELRVRSNAV